MNLPGQNILLQINDVEGYRKFCNKLWNATKFCMFKLDMVDIDGVRLKSDFVPNKTDAVCGFALWLAALQAVLKHILIHLPRKPEMRPLRSDGSSTS